MMKQPQAGRADFVRALSVDLDVHGFVADQLGFEHVPTVVTDADDAETPGTREGSEATAAGTAAVSAAPRPPVLFWRAQRHRVRDMTARLSVREVDATGTIPEPPRPQVAVEPFAPLASFTEVFTRLRHRTELRRSGRLVDVDRLVSDLSRGRELFRIPRLSRRTWGEGLHIVVDLSRRLIPYRDDQQLIAAKLKRLLPSTGASVCVLRDGHRVPLTQWPDDRAEDVLNPAPGDTILVLSDLGTLQQRDRQSEDTWIRLGRRWRAQQCRTLALVPCRPDAIPQRLADLWSPVRWEQSSGTGAAPTAAETLAARDRLLALLSRAVRIEPQLLRAVRRLFDAGRSDPGLESLVWQAAADGITDHCSAASLSKAEATRLRQATSGDELEQQAWQLIQAFHQAEYAGVRVTEIANQSDESERLVSPEDRRWAAAWFESVWKDVRDRGEEADGAVFFSRASRQLSEAAFEAIPVLHRLQYRLCPDEAPPKGYDPALAGVDAPQQTVHVALVGDQLEYRRQGEAAECSTPLATVQLKNPQIVVDELEDWPADEDQAFWRDGTPPAWADRWGRDAVGPWVEFVIDEARQRMRWIPAGEFLMGSPEKPEWEPYPETPQQPVTISRGFWMFDTPCTQAVWQAVTGENPSHFAGERRPVEQVRWEDCQQFLSRINERCRGLELNLPTEAEWEYACRAGTETPTYAGDGPLDQIAWYSGNADDRTHDVGELQPNAWGLHDTLGNVWEWCRDYGGRPYTSDAASDPVQLTDSESADRVIRGGSWAMSARSVRAAYRDGYPPGNRGENLGFRCSSSGSEPVEGGRRPTGKPGGRRPQTVRSERAVSASEREEAEPRVDREPASEDRSIRLTTLDAEYKPVPQGPIVRIRTDLEDVYLCQTLRPTWATRSGRDQYGLWAEFTVPQEHAAARTEVQGQQQAKSADAVTQRMRWIPPGRFLMGSPESEPGRYGGEGPQHEACVSEGFWLFDTPCTQALWEAVMGQNPSHFKGPARPVENISWGDCREFLPKLSEAVGGLSVQLPSETQWEYACRAGTVAATYVGGFDPGDEATQDALKQIAWYAKNAGGETHVVAELLPNPWGLHDMVGNVGEWCQDTWRGNYDQPHPDDKPSAIRVIRGGSWAESALHVRAAYRVGLPPGSRLEYLGFRCSSSGE